MSNDTDDQPAIPLPEQPPKKASAFVLAATPLEEPEPVEVHKFEVAPAVERLVTPVEPLPAFEDLGALPGSYGDERIFLVARDPRWLFCYWEFDWTKYPATGMRGGRAQFFLRITKEDGAQETIVEIPPDVRNWYVPVSAPDTTYLAEIGFFARDGGWSSILTSSGTKTPPDALAEEETAAEFATVPAQLSFERMLQLVQQEMEEGEGLLESVARITGEGRKMIFNAGAEPSWTGEQKALLAALLGNSVVDQVGLGSEEIDQLLRKHLALEHESAGGLAADSELWSPVGSSLFSALGASWSAQPFSTRYERGFYMHVNAEIIFYGGTHPDARVTINGVPIALSPAGNFRYHFTFPDGDFSIPIIARSPDGLEERAATLSFARGTGKTGDVTDTAQPPELDPLIGGK